MKTLVIAPTTDLLLVRAEVSAVINNLRATVMDGDVTADDVLEKLSEQWDAVWFATHGDEKGVYLTDGVLGSSALTSFIRGSGATLVVFNTCSSIEVAQAIYNELLIDLVCTLSPVPDQTAFFTGKLFAIQLGKGKSPHAAYLIAKPGGNANYIFMSKQETAMPPAVRESADESPKASEELLRLVRLMDGDKRDKQPGVLDRMENLETQVSNLRADLRFMRIGIWVLAGSSAVVTLILIGVLVFGRGG